MKKLSLVLAAMMAALTLLLEILREAQAQTPRREIRLLG